MIALIALAAIGLCVAAIVAVTLFDVVRRPMFRRLAVRNAVRRRNEALLIVLGSLFGTAIATTAFVVGDTLDSSLRDGARTRLGPIDEVVLVHHSAALTEAYAKVTAKPLADTDGTLAMVTASATAATTPGPDGARLAEPEAFVHEIDRSPGLLVIESLNGSLQAGGNTLSVAMKIQAFVREEPAAIAQIEAAR